MEPVYDIAVVGAGAAGLTAAIFAASANGRPRVALFDSREKIGAKILISGGTRCNVTNVRVTPEDYQGGPRHFIKHVFQAFTPDQTKDFFKEIGVELVLEPTGKYFPVTHSGKTVLEALMRCARERGVLLKTGARIAEIRKEKDVFKLIGESERVAAKKVILATGGLSYPETGSDGTGYRLAKSLGHGVTETFPSLTPLESGEDAWKELSGVTIDAKLSFYLAGKKRAEFEGSLLFTHFGFSGPVALDISRFVAAHLKEGAFRLEASFLPHENEESFKNLIDRERDEKSKRQLKNFLMDRFSFPERLALTLLHKAAVDENVPLNRLKQAEQKRLTQAIFRQDINVTGVLGYKKAEVTAGGIPLGEVNVGTMESKKTPGLYFCGEILDADGRIGGFNFQWAWSTGFVAGTGAAKACGK